MRTRSTPAPISLEEATALLEEDIVFGKLHPRERLVEEDLIKRFAIKRHVARELLMNLERMGLVERRKNIGAFVRSFSSDEVVELYELRTLLEREAILSISFPVNTLEIEALKALQRLHDQAVQNQDARQVFRINQTFHEALFSICKNKTLLQAIREYARQTHSIRFITLTQSDYREKSRLEHWAMIGALEHGDQKKLLDLCEQHLTPSKNTYLAMNQARQD